MNFHQYIEHFEGIINSESPQAPYDDPHYMDYAKLNWSRTNRWLKNGILTDETKNALKNISGKQKWVLISEPWCGDAAHSVPFIGLIAQECDNIELEIQLRDSNSEIDNYLTNGGKSIPILIIRDANNKDITVWGPRPANFQADFLRLKESGVPMDDIKAELQKWYNADKGQTIQREIIAALSR